MFKNTTNDTRSKSMERTLMMTSDGRLVRTLAVDSAESS